MPPPPLSKIDAYQTEQYLGDIMRYLKTGLYGTPRYPHLHQVFLTSRIYGGYSRNADGSNGGSGTKAGCQSPEPFAYEEGFGVQRTIVAQIDRTSTDWAGSVRYPEDSPWVDWGPYRWASGDNPRQSDNLFWCDSANKGPTSRTKREKWGTPFW
jgi:hypothetical protein